MNQDKLIEWLKEMEQKAFDAWDRTDDRFSWGENSAFEDVREKIESGFFNEEDKP